MSKSSVFSNPAFQVQTSPSLIKTNLLPESNSFNSIFDTQPLDEEEVARLKSLLSESASTLSKEQIEQDTLTLKQITTEIKAIDKQGVILLGQRVKQARELLKPYRDGTFTQWLETAFGSKKSGYNALAYYELYQALPGEESKEAFKKLPNKAAYILASREATIEVKADVISSCREKTSKEAIDLIKQSFPSKEDDKRVKTPEHKKLIQEIIENLEKLQRVNFSIDSTDKKNLELIFTLLNHECLKYDV